MKRLPVILIAGRQNVGKSSLFNMLSKRRISIVHPIPGTTIDAIRNAVDFDGTVVQIVDAAGIEFERQDEISVAARERVFSLIREANVIIFMVDAQEGLTSIDENVADLIRKSGKPVVLVVNKCDTPRKNELISDFYALGFGEPVPFSVAARRGTEDMIEQVKKVLAPDDKDYSEPIIRVTIIGRRNSGKSTLLNALCGGEFAITSSVPGTTRDPVSIITEHGNFSFNLTDTAGFYRGQSPQKSSVDILSQFRLRHSVKNASLLLYVIDCTVGALKVEQEFSIFLGREYKPMILLLNKWDLVDEKSTSTEYLKYIRKRLPSFDFAPVYCISALKKRNLDKIYGAISKVWSQVNLKGSTGKLNKWVREITEHRTPPLRGTKVPRVYYATQTGIQPVEITLFVNYPDAFKGDYVKYMARSMREISPWTSVPIKIVFKKRN